MNTNGKQQNDLEKIKTTGADAIDGYIAGPNGEMDWLVWNWDDKLKEYVNELTESVDSILPGRKMTEGFISYWSDVMAKLPRLHRNLNLSLHLSQNRSVSRRGTRRRRTITGVPLSFKAFLAFLHHKLSK